ncbi:helix-turn-helix transcriptional regulator [Nibrella saemangeumensis]|uniref:helix-turn-helix transcriptional regulator n=1 Tax=Nibrella saemangeumensis TaxID=1084526 RepID=UPI0031EDFBC2
MRNIILIAALLLVLAGWYAFRQNQRKRLQEKQVLLEQQQRAEQLLVQYMTHLQEKNQLIESISAELNQVEPPISPNPSIEGLLNRVILTDADWQQFKSLFEDVHPGFFSTLRNRHPDLTRAEVRLLALLKLRIDTGQMSRMLGISPESIHKTKYRMLKKLGDNAQSTLVALLANGEVRS